MGDSGEAQLVLEGDFGRVVLPGSALLVGLDETGHEALSDPGYPLFGLGGCATLVADYPRLVRDPWRYMRRRFFNLEDEAPLHAAALNAPSAEQLEALGQFFRRFQFSRLAAVATDQTLFGEDLACLPIVGGCMLERLRHVIAWYPQATEVALVFEESQRATPAIMASVTGYKFSRREADGTSTDLPIRLCAMSKKGAEPCLEVADFIMHAAGTQTRTRLAGAKQGGRRDFRAVFRDVDERLTSFLEITSANTTA